jgi:hypothetical protein
MTDQDRMVREMYQRAYAAAMQGMWGREAWSFEQCDQAARLAVRKYTEFSSELSARLLDVRKAEGCVECGKPVGDNDTYCTTCLVQLRCEGGP